MQATAAKSGAEKRPARFGKPNSPGAGTRPKRGRCLAGPYGAVVGAFLGVARWGELARDVRAFFFITFIFVGVLVRKTTP